MRYTVKSLGAGRIEAYGVRWGSADEPDQSEMQDFFTPQTDLWLDKFGFPRPILLEHSITRESDPAPIVGEWHRAAKDHIGVKLAGQLDQAHPQYARIDADIQAGRYYLSSDSAGHLVRRRPAAKGTHELVRWPLITCSLTRSPAEHRLLPVTALKAAFKAIGRMLDLEVKAGARHSATDQQALDAAHAAIVAAGAVCAPAGKSLDAEYDYWLRSDAPDAFDQMYRLDQLRAPGARKARILYELKGIEVQERITRLRETDGQKRARILRELRAIERSNR